MAKLRVPPHVDYLIYANNSYYIYCDHRISGGLNF